MNKMKSNTLLNCMFSIFLLLILGSEVHAVDKLVIKNQSGVTVSKVDDTGSMYASGMLDLTSNLSKIRQIRTDGKMQQMFNIDTNNDMILNRSALVYDNYRTGVVVGIQDGSVDFRSRVAGTQKYLMKILSNGNVGFGITSPTHLIQLSGGAYSDGATWVDASSRELKENIKDVSVEEAVATLESLTPVQYNYKADKKEQHVGFIAEDVPDMVATKDRKGLSPMDVTAVLTKVVQEQQKMIAELQSQIAELKTEIQFKKDKGLAFSQVTSHE